MYRVNTINEQTVKISLEIAHQEKGGAKVLYNHFLQRLERLLL